MREREGVKSLVCVRQRDDDEEEEKTTFFIVMYILYIFLDNFSSCYIQFIERLSLFLCVLKYYFRKLLAALLIFTLYYCCTQVHFNLEIMEIF